MKCNILVLAVLFSMVSAAGGAAQYLARRNGGVVELEDAKNQTVVRDPSIRRQHHLLHEGAGAGNSPLAVCFA